MDRKQLRKLLLDFKRGILSADQVLNRLRFLPYEDLGFVSIDHHRQLRQNMAEAIFCQGKTTQQVIEIATRLRSHGAPVLATRVEPETACAVLKNFAEARHYPLSRLVVIGSSPARKRGRILVITAGTSDVPVAEEVKVSAEILGSRVATLFDVGVAGLHRLLDRQRELAQARVLVVVAGMDGVLPSVVGGLVQQPVIAVPTSHGYGTGVGGIAALMTMLNSCAPGVGVMNIDNGFGAGCLAHRINIMGKP